METTISDLQTKLAAQAKDHEAEFDAFCKEYDRRVMQSLSTRGISISQLAGQADPKTSISSPSKARELRELRIELGLSQEEAGAIVQKYLDTPITKAGWSKMETSGNGPHFAEAMAALSAERHVRNKAAKAALPSGTAPTPDEIYAFNRAGILQTEPVTAEGASK